MMYSIPIVTTAIIALLSSHARAEEYVRSMQTTLLEIVIFLIVDATSHTTFLS